MGALAATTVVAGGAALGQPAIKQIAGSQTYIAKDFTGLIGRGLNGLSANQIEQHLKLYKGYVAKANEIQGKLKDVDVSAANATYAPLRELLVEQSFALNGVIYHELYFANLGGAGGEPAGELRQALEEKWGALGKFIDYLKAAGKCMRGWVIIGWNTRDGHVHCYGLDMHNMWVPAGVIPILVLDVYEHAYMIDYGVDRAKYLDAFVNNLDWDVVAKRFAAACKHHTCPET
ncbi:MAG: superoxide dismutase [Candidatus Melainabacteria bacterium]|nr:superoxide dismutase [Candidatus Melainabacteria bacterium]